MTLAFRNDYINPGNTTSGIEFSIPVSAIPGVVEGDYVRFFAIITNSFGLMSNETIPGNPGGANLGCGFNFSSVPNQQFYTAFWLLPFNFLHFEAKSKKSGVELDWLVSGNNEIEKFEIETSIDGTRFTKIQEISSTSGQENRSYSYFVEHVQKGYTYYRISAIDRKGKSAKSETRKVMQAIARTNPVISPNPISNSEVRFLTNGLVKGNYELQLMGLDGRKIQSRQWNYDGLQSFGSLVVPSTLSKGTYWLRIVGEQMEPVQLKLIK
jgi:hypothetical protein